MASQSSNGTVYIVDDHYETVKSLSQLLQSVSLPVETFTSASAFLLRCEQPLDGCLVLDMLMPEMNGLELMARLKELRIRIPVIVVSGYGDVPSAVHAMRLGALDFIQKPYSVQAIINRIQEALRLNCQWREREKANAAILSAARGMTPREREILKVLVEGVSTKEIANRLRISTKTVDVHRMHIMHKMNACSAGHLIVMGMKIYEQL